MLYHVGAEGPKDARIAVVAEKGAQQETIIGRPMVGYTGSLIRMHLAKSGLDAGSGFWQYVPGEKGRPSKDVYLTNAVHNFNDPSANPTTADIIREQSRLYKELADLPNLNCILAVGAHALASLSNFKYVDILNRRGSRLMSALGVKMVCSVHPSFYVQGEWRYQTITQFDFNRAAEESLSPKLLYPKRNFYIRPKSFDEARSWLDEIIDRPLSNDISFDIETFQGRLGTWYVSCIAFSDHPGRAFCIPIMDRRRRSYWTIPDERRIWQLLQCLLDLPDRCYITQNGHAFDCYQLRRHGIATPHMARGFDTYSSHSLLAPDLPHDLGFLVSIYTQEAYYKDESGRADDKEFGHVGDDQFWIYNCKDAACTLEVAYGIMSDLQEHGMYGTQNVYGDSSVNSQR